MVQQIAMHQMTQTQGNICTCRWHNSSHKGHRTSMELTQWHQYWFYAIFSFCPRAIFYRYIILLRNVSNILVLQKRHKILERPPSCFLPVPVLNTKGGRIPTRRIPSFIHHPRLCSRCISLHFLTLGYFFVCLMAL